MSGIWQALAASDEVKRAGWMVLHSIWLGAGAAGLLAVGEVFLRRRSANARYLVACGMMVVLLGACAAAYVFAPGARGELARAAGAKDMQGASLYGNGEFAANLGADGMWQGTAQSFVPPKAPNSFWMKAARRVEPTLPWISGVWLTGVGALAIWQLSAWFGIGRIRRLALRVEDEGVNRTVDRLACGMKIRRPVALLESALVKTPALIGWLSPAILLPAGLISGISPAQLRAILAHELAHVRRHDYVANLLQTIVETLFFFHPAVWHISARIRALREDCCDDMVIAGGEEAADYAQSLLCIARRALEQRAMLNLSPAMALGAVGKPSEIRRRIRRMLGGERPARLANNWPGAFLLIAAMLAGVLFHAGSRMGIAGEPSSIATPGTPPEAPQWGEAKDGLRARIIADKQAFHAGEAIPVRLEIENVGEKVKEYQTPAAPDNSTLIVLDERGQAVPYLGGLSQVMVRAEKLEPGKAKELKSFDLAEWYYLRRPGRYTVQWPEEIILRSAPDDPRPVPQSRASAPFEFDVTADAKLANADGDPVARLLPLVKKKWWITATQSKPAKLNPGANHAQVMGRFIAFAYHPTGYINDTGLVWLWLTDEEAAEQPATAQWPPKSDYLGKIDRWHVYMNVNANARKGWANPEEDIKKALSGAPIEGNATVEDKNAAEQTPKGSGLQFRLVAQADDKSEADEMPDPSGGKPIRVLKTVELDARDIAKAYETKGTSGPAVGIDLSPEGGKKLEKLTTANINHRLAMILDGKLLCAPTIRSAISKSLVITGSEKDFTPEKVKAMVESINAGLKAAEDAKPNLRIR